MNKFLLLILTVFAAAVSGCSSLFSTKYVPGNPTEELQYDLSHMFADSNFSNANWGVLVTSLKNGDTLFALNERKMFMPASNMKLVSTASGLAVLTPEFRYRTTLATSGTISHDTLFGDLVLKGSGDPSIGTRFNDSIPTKVFQEWADSLRANGIAVVRGSIIGDDNCFDEEYYGEGWAADYETDWYAAQVGGIVYNDNCIDVTITPDSVVGQPCHFALSPDTRYASFTNNAVTAAPADSDTGILFHRQRGTNRVEISGSLRAGGSPWIESIAIDNPTQYALTVLKETFAAKGIAVTGRTIDIDDLDSIPSAAEWKQLASYESPALAEIVKATNKPSQNLYAEQIFRSIGAERMGQGSMRNAKRVAYPILAGWGVDTVRLRMWDGSGLSRLDLITPRDIVSILTGMYRGPARDAFYESLPIAGVDGSLKNRMKGTAAEGNVHAKTGFVGYVRSLSGYVTDREGEMLAFSMIANHYTVPTRMAESIQNAVCVRLAEFSRTQFRR